MALFLISSQSSVELPSRCRCHLLTSWSVNLTLCFTLIVCMLDQNVLRMAVHDSQSQQSTCFYLQELPDNIHSDAMHCIVSHLLSVVCWVCPVVGTLPLSLAWGVYKRLGLNSWCKCICKGIKWWEWHMHGIECAQMWAVRCSSSSSDVLRNWFLRPCLSHVRHNMNAWLLAKEDSNWMLVMSAWRGSLNRLYWFYRFHATMVADGFHVQETPFPFSVSCKILNCNRLKLCTKYQPRNPTLLIVSWWLSPIKNITTQTWITTIWICGICVI